MRTPAGIPLYNGDDEAASGVPKAAQELKNAVDWLPALRTLGTKPWFGGRMLVSRAQDVFDETGRHLGTTGEDRFRLLVESVRDYAIFLLDPDGHVASWSPGAGQFKGYKAEEIIGRHFSVFYRKADVEAGRQLATA